MYVYGMQRYDSDGISCVRLVDAEDVRQFIYDEWLLSGVVGDEFRMDEVFDRLHTQGVVHLPWMRCVLRSVVVPDRTPAQ